MVWEYFSDFYKSALCYTDVHVYRATSLCVALRRRLKKTDFGFFVILSVF